MWFGCGVKVELVSIMNLLFLGRAILLRVLVREATHQAIILGLNIDS